MLAVIIIYSADWLTNEQMKPITLTISRIDRLNVINSKLRQNANLTSEDQTYLSEFLSQLPTVETLLAANIPFDIGPIAKVWDVDKFEESLDSWKQLFDNIPGYDYVSCWFVQHGELELLKENVVMTVTFAPSMAYNLSKIDPIWIYLKDDGSAKFRFEKLADAEQYPELYNFRGTWKEAYLLLIETLKKGWPMEEFPEELKPFLKK